MLSQNSHSIIASQALRAWLANIFLRLKFSEQHANLATDVLLMADLRGIDSHGVARLSGYIRLIEAGRINPKPNLQFTQRKKATGHLDADGAIGLVSAPFAMQKAIEMTHECGSGWVGISNSNHFGIAAYHAMMALEHNYIGFSTTNASPLVAPAGGAERGGTARDERGRRASRHDATHATAHRAQGRAGRGGGRKLSVPLHRNAPCPSTPPCAPASNRCWPPTRSCCS